MKPLRLHRAIPSLSLASAICAVLLTSAGAAGEIPQTPGSNVLITKCDARPYYASEPGFHVSPYKNGLLGVLTVAYQNQASSAATDVVFGLVSDGKLLTRSDDAGNFAPGAAIGHDLMLYQQIFPLKAAAHCVVLGVQYADGETWLNPSPPRL
jgi:hypothetical protein